MTEEAADAWIDAWAAQAARDSVNAGRATRTPPGVGSPSSDGRGCGLEHLDAGAYGAGMIYEERQRRLDRARVAIRLELALGFLAPVVLAFVIVAKPWITSPTFVPGPLWFPLLMALPAFIGGAGVVFGLVWLVRLSRPDPERGEVHWRYRDF